MKPRVSIIVPVYKVGQYLARCIDSVLGQSFQDWELILVDDGSPDESGAICDAYASADSRIRAIHQANAGVSAARNAGLDAISGDLVAFLDGDDWWHEEHLSTLTQLMERYQADITGCGFVRTTDRAPRTGFADSVHVLTRDETLAWFLGSKHALMSVVWGKLYQRTVIGDSRFPVGLIHEDEFFAPSAYLRADRMVMTDQVLYYYWQRDDSIMGSGYSADGGAAMIAAAVWLRDQLDGHPLRPAASEQLMRRLARRYRWGRTQHEDSGDVAQLRSTIRSLERETRSEPHSVAFRVFAFLYATCPGFVLPLHRWYLRRTMK